MGYYQAGFDPIVGIDNHPQPRFPFDFIQRDAVEYVVQYGHEFDLIHASPPCQIHSKAYRIMRGNHPDLISNTRNALYGIGKPFIIENVIGAPLVNPIMLCGAMFSLRTYRHRLFEIHPFKIEPPPHPEHTTPTTKMGRRLKPNTFMIICGKFIGVDDAREIMGTNWMLGREMAQAIPPAYTKWIGEKIRALLC